MSRISDKPPAVCRIEGNPGQPAHTCESQQQPVINTSRASIGRPLSNRCHLLFFPLREENSSSSSSSEEYTRTAVRIHHSATSSPDQTRDQHTHKIVHPKRKVSLASSCFFDDHTSHNHLRRQHAHQILEDTEAPRSRIRWLRSYRQAPQTPRWSWYGWW